MGPPGPRLLGTALAGGCRRLRAARLTGLLTRLLEGRFTGAAVIVAHEEVTG